MRSFPSLTSSPPLFLLLVITYISLHTPFTLATQPPTDSSSLKVHVVRGGGSSLAEEVHKELGIVFTSKYNVGHKDTTLSMLYNPMGSGRGLSSFIAGGEQDLEYCGSDTAPRRTEAPDDLQMIPVMATSVAILYNVNGIMGKSSYDLILSREVIVDIFTGKIAMWDDERIGELNPTLKLPAIPIIRVVRSDISGTTRLFTEALSSFNEAEWEQGITALPKWPKDDSSLVHAEGNTGVQMQIAAHDGSIGYGIATDLLDMRAAAIRNRAGELVRPDEKATQAAMEEFVDALQLTPTDDLSANSLTDGSNAASYPISGYTYLVYRSRSMKSWERASLLSQYFYFMFQERGAEIMRHHKFVPLSMRVREKAHGVLKQWSVNGRTVMIVSNKSMWISIGISLATVFAVLSLAVCVVGSIMMIACLTRQSSQGSKSWK